MAGIGLIVNPSASRDVRRLTSLARTISVHERVNVVARILCGMSASGVDAIFYMPEGAHVVERAADALEAAGTRFAANELVLQSALPEGVQANDAAGTTRAALAMAEAGISCLVTVGGDGTHRAASIGWGEAVLLPLPGGTNNAFAIPVDPTAGGLAAGLYASAPERFASHVRPTTRLEVRIHHGDDDPPPPAGSDGPVSIALVDVALVAGGWVGAHAIWDPTLLLEAVLARSDPALTGLAGVGGMLDPSDGELPRGLHVRFGRPGPMVTVPLGPGQLVPVAVRTTQVVGLDAPVLLAGTTLDPAGLPLPATLAFDGEREIVLAPGDRAEVRLTVRGPRVLDAPGLLRRAAADGMFWSDAIAGVPA